MATHEGTTAAFDAKEQEILSKLDPTLDPVDQGESQPGDTNAVATPAPAPAATPAAATPAPTTAPAPSPTAAPAPGAPVPSPAPTPAPTEAPAAPQGDVKGALRASRQSEKRLRDALKAKEEEIEALKAGKNPVDTEVTDEELVELEENFPVQAKAIREMRALKKQVEAIAPRAQADEFIPVSYAPEVQEIIDGVPQLQAWQFDPASQDKFARAIEYDKALALDPDWKDRPIADRFGEAARRTLAATGSPAPSAAPAAARLDPAQVAAAAQVEGPKGISDFRGGAPANAPAQNYNDMSDEQIMRSLPVE